MQWMALLFSLAVVGGQGLHTLESRRAPVPVTAVPLGPTDLSRPEVPQSVALGLKIASDQGVATAAYGLKKAEGS